ncbi:MAG: methyltransferase domain-containing protein [Geminicoccaceae bacterium]
MADPAERWQPDAYLRYSDQRLRPGLDLLARIELDTPARIVDLGCGPGNLSAFLARRWPDASLTLVDSSPAMLAKAAKHLPEATCVAADIATWVPAEPLDLIFSNAALHWLDDHASLFARLLGYLAPGGVLAVQMPRNYGAPSHALVNETAADGPWASALAGVLTRWPVAAPEAYADWLSPHARALDLWTTTYYQWLTGEDAVLAWMRATTLLPIRDALDAQTYARFEDALGARLRIAYPPRADGRTLFPFTRLFLRADAA